MPVNLIDHEVLPLHAWYRHGAVEPRAAVIIASRNGQPCTRFVWYCEPVGAISLNSVVVEPQIIKGVRRDAVQPFESGLASTSAIWFETIDGG